MKKSYSKLLILVMALVMSMSMAASVFADDTADGKFAYDGSEISFIKEDGAAFGMWTPQEGTTILYKDGKVEATIVPKNKTVFGWMHWGLITDEELTKDVTVEENGSIVLSLDADMCGFAHPVAPIKVKDGTTTSEQYYLAVPALKYIPVDLKVTNNTGMFKVVNATVKTVDDKDTLNITLSGSGYHELFKGTYEEAVANGDNEENWIHGTQNLEGKYEFEIPLEKDETNIPLVAISNSYYQKYKNGQNELARAFYPRQIEVDKEAKTLVTSDYDQTFEVKVTNNVSMFKPGEKADLRVVGGPNSNNYGAFLTLHMGSDSMSNAKSYKFGYMNKELTIGDEVVVPMGEGNIFTEIPVLPAILGDSLTLEFQSKRNENWYKRDLTIDLEKKEVTFDEYAGDVLAKEIGKLESVEAAEQYAKEHASAKNADLLIEAIQVQSRTDSTDKLCAAAKACWDALSDDEKKEVEEADYFGRNTGDASADDPLNQDEIGEKELLVVSFGTSFNDSRANDIGGIEKALAKAYPGWSVRRAFTAQIIINHVQARDGEKIDNMEQALDRAVANGVKELVVQPTHLMHGAEYDELKEAVDAYADKFDSVVIAEPLLGQVGDEAATVNADKEATAKAAVAEAVKVAGFDSLDAAEKDGTAFVFMGHGTSHDAAITYDQMQAQMKELGYNNVFIGTVEGNPADTALPEVKKAVEAAGYERVILRPLMVVAGDHANNDMAANEKGSWYYAFVNGGEFEVEGSDKPVKIGEGFGADNVKCQIEGLGRIPAIQKMYVAHTLDAINEIEPITKINSKVLELVQNQELIDAYLKASAFVDEYKPLVDAIVKNLDNGDTSDIEAYGRQLDELIKEMYDYAADYAAELEEDPEIKAAIDEVIAKAEELNDLLKEYGIDLSDGISEEEKAIIEEKIEEAKADLDKAIADLMDALNEEVLKEALDEFIAQAKDWAKDAAKEAGLTDEEIEEFMKQIEDLAAIVEEYAGMEPSEALDKLIEDAKALIEENADELKELAQQAINDAYEAFQNGDYDEYIAKTGLDPETVKAAVDDLVAYAMGAAAGDTYTALQDKVAALTEQLEKAQADAAAAQDALDQLKKDAEAQKASAEEKDAVIKQFINGYNVTKKKPTMKKAKAAKKKKVKVTFKGLKGAEATSYQISYKTGKKTKKKTVKKATTSAKKLNYTLKKLKKGKKYTVKVRAIYQFKYNGKTYKFMSKWSKGKKVKVK